MEEGGPEELELVDEYDLDVNDELIKQSISSLMSIPLEYMDDSEDEEEDEGGVDDVERQLEALFDGEETQNTIGLENISDNELSVCGRCSGPESGECETSDGELPDSPKAPPVITLEDSPITVELSDDEVQVQAVNAVISSKEKSVVKEEMESARKSESREMTEGSGGNKRTSFLNIVKPILSKPEGESLTHREKQEAYDRNERRKSSPSKSGKRHDSPIKLPGDVNSNTEKVLSDAQKREIKFKKYLTRMHQYRQKCLQMMGKVSTKCEKLTPGTAKTKVSKEFNRMKSVVVEPTYVKSVAVDHRAQNNIEGQTIHNSSTVVLGNPHDLKGPKRRSSPSKSKTEKKRKTKLPKEIKEHKNKHQSNRLYSQIEHNTNSDERTSSPEKHKSKSRKRQKKGRSSSPEKCKNEARVQPPVLSFMELCEDVPHPKRSPMAKTIEQRTISSDSGVTTSSLRSENVDSEDGHEDNDLFITISQLVEQDKKKGANSTTEKSRQKRIEPEDPEKTKSVEKDPELKSLTVFTKVLFKDDEPGIPFLQGCPPSPKQESAPAPNRFMEATGPDEIYDCLDEQLQTISPSSLSPVPSPAPKVHNKALLNFVESQKGLGSNKNKHMKSSKSTRSRSKSPMREKVKKRKKHHHSSISVSSSSPDRHRRHSPRLSPPPSYQKETSATPPPTYRKRSVSPPPGYGKPSPVISPSRRPTPDHLKERWKDHHHHHSHSHPHPRLHRSRKRSRSRTRLRAHSHSRSSSRERALPYRSRPHHSRSPPPRSPPPLSALCPRTRTRSRSRTRSVEEVNDNKMVQEKRRRLKEEHERALDSLRATMRKPPTDTLSCKPVSIKFTSAGMDSFEAWRMDNYDPVGMSEDDSQSPVDIELDPPLPAEVPPQPPGVQSAPQELYTTFVPLPPTWLPPPMQYHPHPPLYPPYQVPPAYHHYPSHRPPVPSFPPPAYSLVPTQPPPPGTYRHADPNITRDPRVQMRKKSPQKATEILRSAGDDKVKITLSFKPRPIAAVGPNNIHEAEFNVDNCNKGVETSNKLNSDLYSEKNYKIEGIVSKLKDTINDSVHEYVPVVEQNEEMKKPVNEAVLEVEKNEEIEKSVETNNPGDEPYDPFNADEEPESENNTTKKMLSGGQIRRLNEQIRNCFSLVLSNSEERKRLTPTLEAIKAKKVEIQNKEKKVESQQKLNIYDSMSSKQSELFQAKIIEYDVSRVEDNLSSRVVSTVGIGIKQNNNIETTDNRSPDKYVGVDIPGIPLSNTENNKELLEFNSGNKRDVLDFNTENKILSDFSESELFQAKIIEYDVSRVEDNLSLRVVSTVGIGIKQKNNIETTDNRSPDKYVGVDIPGIPLSNTENNKELLEFNSGNKRDVLDFNTENKILSDFSESSGNHEQSKCKVEVAKYDSDKHKMYETADPCRNMSGIADHIICQNQNNVETSTKEFNVKYGKSSLKEDKEDRKCPLKENLVNCGTKSELEIPISLVESREKGGRLSSKEELDNGNTTPKNQLDLPESNENDDILSSKDEGIDYDNFLVKRDSQNNVMNNGVLFNKKMRDGAKVIKMPQLRMAGVNCKMDSTECLNTHPPAIEAQVDHIGHFEKDLEQKREDCQSPRHSSDSNPDAKDCHVNSKDSKHLNFHKCPYSSDLKRNPALSIPTKAELKRFPSPKVSKNSTQSDIQQIENGTIESLSVLEIKETKTSSKSYKLKCPESKHVSRKDQSKRSSVSISCDTSTYVKNIDANEPKIVKVKHSETRKAMSLSHDKNKKQNRHPSRTVSPKSDDNIRVKKQEQISKLKTEVKHTHKPMKEEKSLVVKRKDNLYEGQVGDLPKTPPQAKRSLKQIASPLSKKSQSFISQNLPTTFNVVRDAELIRKGFNKTPRIILKRIPSASSSGRTKCQSSSLEDSTKNFEVKSNFSSRALINLDVGINNISLQYDADFIVLSKNKMQSEENQQNDELCNESVQNQYMLDTRISEDKGTLLNDCGGYSKEVMAGETLDCEKSKENIPKKCKESTLHHLLSPTDQSTSINVYYEGILKTLNEFHTVPIDYCQPRKVSVLTIPNVENIPEIKLRDSQKRMPIASNKHKIEMEENFDLIDNDSDQSKTDENLMTQLTTADLSQGQLLETESAASNYSCKSSEPNEGDVDSVILDKELSDLAKGCLDVSADPSDESSLDGDFHSSSSRGKFSSAFNIKRRLLSRKLRPFDKGASLKYSDKKKLTSVKQGVAEVTEPDEEVKSLDCDKQPSNENSLYTGKCELNSADGESLAVNATLTSSNEEGIDSIKINTSKKSMSDFNAKQHEELIKNDESLIEIQGNTIVTFESSSSDSNIEDVHIRLNCAVLNNLEEIEILNKPVAKRTRRGKQLAKVKNELKVPENKLAQTDNITTTHVILASKEHTKNIKTKGKSGNIYKKTSKGTEKTVETKINIDSMLVASIPQNINLEDKESIDNTNDDKINIQTKCSNDAVGDKELENNSPTSLEVLSTSCTSNPREARRTWQRNSSAKVIGKTTIIKDPTLPKFPTLKLNSIEKTHDPSKNTKDEGKPTFQFAGATLNPTLPPCFKKHAEASHVVSRSLSTESSDEPLMVVKERLLAGKVINEISQKMELPLNLKSVDIKSNVTSCSTQGASERTNGIPPSKSNSDRRETTNNNGSRGFDSNIDQIHNLQSKDIFRSNKESYFSSSDEEKAINLIIRKDSSVLPVNMNCFTSNKHNDLFHLKIKEASRKTHAKAEVDAEIKRRLAEIDKLEKTTKLYQSASLEINRSSAGSINLTGNELLNPGKYTSDDCVYISTDDSGDSLILNYSKSANSIIEKTQEKKEVTHTEEPCTTKAMQGKVIKNYSHDELCLEKYIPSVNLPPRHLRITRSETSQVEEVQHSNEPHVKYSLMQSQFSELSSEIVNSNKARRSARKKTPSKRLREVDSEGELFNIIQDELRAENDMSSNRSETLKTQHFLPETSDHDLKSSIPFSNNSFFEGRENMINDAFDHLKPPNNFKRPGETDDQFTMPIAQPEIDKCSQSKDIVFKGAIFSRESQNSFKMVNQEDMNNALQSNLELKKICQAPEPDSSTPSITINYCFSATCGENQSLSKEDPQFLETSFRSLIPLTQGPEIVESSLASNAGQPRRKPLVQRRKRKKHSFKRYQSKLLVCSDKTSDSFNSDQTDTLSDEIVSSSVNIRVPSTNNKKRKRKSCVDLLMEDSMLSVTRDIPMTPNPYLMQSFDEEKEMSTSLSKDNVISYLKPAIKETVEGSSSAPKPDLLAHKLKLLEKLKNVNRRNRKTRQCRTLVCYNEDSLPESLVDSPVSESPHESEKGFLPQEEDIPLHMNNLEDLDSKTVKNTIDHSDNISLSHKKMRTLKPSLCKPQLNKIRKVKKQRNIKRGRQRNVENINHSSEFSCSITTDASLNKSSSSTLPSKSILQIGEDIAEKNLDRNISEFDKLLQNNPMESKKMSIRNNSRGSSPLLLEEDKSNDASDYFYNSFPSPLLSDSEVSSLENPTFFNVPQSSQKHSKILPSKTESIKSVQIEKIMCSIPIEKIAKTLSLFKESFTYPSDGEKSADNDDDEDDDDDIPLSVKLLQYQTESRALHFPKQELSSQDKEFKIQSTKQSEPRKRTVSENVCPIRKSKRSIARSHISYNLDSEDSATTSTEISECNKETLSDPLCDNVINEDLKLNLGDTLLENRHAINNSRNSCVNLSGTTTSNVRKKRGRPPKVQSKCEKMFVKDTTDEFLDTHVDINTNFRDGRFNEIEMKDVDASNTEECQRFESQRRLRKNLKLKDGNEYEGVKSESESTDNSTSQLLKCNKLPELNPNNLNSKIKSITPKITRAKRSKIIPELPNELVQDKMIDSNKNDHDVYDYLEDDEVSSKEALSSKRLQMLKPKECPEVPSLVTNNTLESKNNQHRSMTINAIDKLIDTNKSTKQPEENKLPDEPPCLIKTRTRRARIQALDNAHLDPPSLESEVSSVVKSNESEDTHQLQTTEYTKEIESSTIITSRNENDIDHLLHKKEETVALSNFKYEPESEVLSEDCEKSTNLCYLGRRIRKKKSKGKHNYVCRKEDNIQEQLPENGHILSDPELKVSFEKSEDNSSLNNTLDEIELHQNTTLPDLNNEPESSDSHNLFERQSIFSDRLLNTVKSQEDTRKQKTVFKETGSIVTAEGTTITTNQTEENPSNVFSKEKKICVSEQSTEGNAYKVANVSRTLNTFSVNPSLPPPMSHDQCTLWSRISMFLNKSTRSVGTQVRSTTKLTLKGCEMVEPEVSLQNEVTLPEVIKALFEELKSTDSSFAET